MKSILIADNHHILRLGIKALAEDVLSDCRVELADVNEELLQKLKTKDYDMLIIDLCIPKNAEVLSVARLLEAQPYLKILAISTNPENIFAGRFLKAGVYGYAEKTTKEENIRDAIRMIIEGKHYFSPGFSQKLLENYLGETSDNPFEKLSDREFEIAMLLLRGMSMGETSHALNIQASTASTHKKRIFDKLRITSLVGLINLGRSHNIIANNN